MAEATCEVGRILGDATLDQYEVGLMILEDPEGYSDEFAATCLRQMRGNYQVHGPAVKQHRAKKCDCKEPASA